MDLIKRRKIIGLFLALVILALPSLCLAGSQDFTLTNKSSRNIIGFWVSPR